MERMQSFDKSLRKHANYFNLRWLFFSPTGILTGLSSYWLKVPPIAIGIRLALLLTGIILAGYVSMSLVPDHNKYCCYGPGIQRRDLGSCEVSNSPISREPLGNLRVKCSAYSFKINMFIVATVLQFVLAAVLFLGYEYEHFHRSYLRNIEKITTDPSIKGYIESSVHQEQSKAADEIHKKATEEFIEHTLFIANTMTCKTPTIHFYASLFPEFYAIGLFLRSFELRWIAKFIIFAQCVTFVLILIISFEEDLYEAWWRCNKPHTPLADLNNGLCKVTLYGRSETWGIWIIIVICMQTVLLVTYATAIYERHADYKKPNSVLLRTQHVDRNVQGALMQILSRFQSEGPSTEPPRASNTIGKVSMETEQLRKRVEQKQPKPFAQKTKVGTS